MFGSTLYGPVPSVHVYAQRIETGVNPTWVSTEHPLRDVSSGRSRERGGGRGGWAGIARGVARGICVGKGVRKGVGKGVGKRVV